MMRSTVLAFLALILPPTLSAEAQELTGTLKQVQERKQFVIGTGESSVPFSYLDEKGQPVGYAVDLCTRIADAVKSKIHDPSIEVKLLPVASNARIPLLSNGTIDLHCGSNTNNVERQKVLAFGPTIFITTSRYVSKKSKKIHSIDDLRGRTVVSTSGSSNMKQLVEMNAQRNLNINILTSRDHAEGFLLVESGRADAFVMDDILLSSFIAGSKDPEAYELSTEAFAKPEPYGIMLRKNDEPFKKLVDETLSAIYENHQIVDLYSRWFENPIPPRGINLKFPIGDKLRKNFAHPTDSPDPDAY